MKLRSSCCDKINCLKTLTNKKEREGNYFYK